MLEKESKGIFAYGTFPGYEIYDSFVPPDPEPLPTNSFWVSSGTQRIYGNTPEEAIDNARKAIVKRTPGWEYAQVGPYANSAQPLIIPVDKVEHWLDKPTKSE